MSENLYSILKCKADASQEEIKQSYQRLVREHHPDKTGDVQTTQTYLSIENAWKVLRSDVLRKEYDAVLMNSKIDDQIIYDTVYLYQLDFNKDENIYTYDCRCGSQYIINTDGLTNVVDECIVHCNECSFCIKVIIKC